MNSLEISVLNEEKKQNLTNKLNFKFHFQSLNLVKFKKVQEILINFGNKLLKSLK